MAISGPSTHHTGEVVDQPMSQQDGEHLPAGLATQPIRQSDSTVPTSRQRWDPWRRRVCPSRQSDAERLPYTIRLRDTEHPDRETTNGSEHSSLILQIQETRVPGFTVQSEVHDLDTGEYSSQFQDVAEGDDIDTEQWLLYDETSAATTSVVDTTAGSIAASVMARAMDTTEPATK